MPRKSRSYDKHTPLPDPKFGSVKYAKFINYLMERGKKSVARKIFYDALEIVKEKMASASTSSAPAASSSANHASVGAGLKPASTAGKASDKSAASKPEKQATQPQKDGKPASGQGAALNQQQQKLDGRQVFDIALKNVAPLMELKSRRIGGANYQVPMEVQEPRRSTMAMKWMIEAARSRKGMPMREKLAAEIVDAYNKQGSAMKKREDTHRMAEANKAFAHFARFGRR